MPSSQSPPRAASNAKQAEEKEEDANSDKPKKTTTRKATKSKATVKDKVIELDFGDLVKARDAYSDEMKKLNDVKKVEKDALMQSKMARMCIFKVPVGIHAPELRDCESMTQWVLGAGD